METINVNALKAKFGRVEKLSEPKYRFSRFLASADLSADGTYGFVRRLLINYGKENNVDIERYLKSSLNFTNINRDEVNICISEFIDVLNSIPDKNECKKELTYIGKLLDIIESNGKVDSNTVDDSFNHDRIPRHIAMYFFSKVDENYWKDRNKSREDVYKELNENVEGRFSNVIYDIRLLQGDISRGDNNYTNNNYIWASNFLNVFRFLRNWKDHFADNITKDDERCAAACFILYTFAANYYAIKKNLIKHGVKDIKDVVIKEKTLSVFFNGELDESLLSEDINEARKLLEPILYEINEQPVPHNETSNKYKYDFTIKREGKYKLKIGEGSTPEDLDMERLWNSPSKNPVVIWNGVHPYFFSDITNVPSQLNQYVRNGQDEETKKLREAIELTKKTIEQNTDAVAGNTIAIKSLEEAIKKLDDTVNKILAGQEKGNKTLSKIEKGQVVQSILIIIVIILGVVFAVKYFTNSRKSEYNDLSAKELVESGDSLLKNSDYKSAGEAYRMAIDTYKNQIAENDNNVEARIQVARMYYLGKGAYNADSAFFFINHKAVRANKCGRGIYAYLLFVRGCIDEVKIEMVNPGIDKNDNYIKLTTILMKLSEPDENKLTKISCKELVDNLETIGTEEAIMALSVVHHDGIKMKSGEYLITPHIGLYYNVIKHLAPQVPLLYLQLSAFNQFLGRLTLAADYGVRAFSCGIQDEAALILTSLCAEGLYGENEETSEFLNYVAGISNQLDNTLSMGSKLMSYLSHNNIELAISEADRLGVALKDSLRKENVGLADMSLPIEDLRISLRLLSGKENRFQEAIKLTIDKSKCKDSAAVALYLRGVQYAKAYGRDRDLIKSDSLINLSAQLGCEEAVYTRLRRAELPTIYCVEGKDLKGHGYLDLGLSVANSNAPIAYGKDGIVEISESALLPDSVWNGNEKLAMYLAFYWKAYYIYSNKPSPYLLSCPESYRVLYDIEKNYRECGMLNDVISESKKHHYLTRLTKAIPEAYYNKEYNTFISLCREFCLFANSCGIDDNIVKAYKQFVDDMKVNYDIMPDVPVYAY